MSKRDFIVIANILKSLPKNVRTPLVSIFTEVLSAEYKSFDKEKFHNYIEGE